MDTFPVAFATAGAAARTAITPVPHVDKLAEILALTCIPILCQRNARRSDRGAEADITSTCCRRSTCTAVAVVVSFGCNCDGADSALRLRSLRLTAV